MSDKSDSKRLTALFLLVLGVVAIISIVPALLDASNNIAVVVGVLIIVGAVYSGIRWGKAILRSIGFDIG